MTQLESGCYVRIGEISGTPLYSFDKNSWYSTEDKALEIYNIKQNILRSKNG